MRFYKRGACNIVDLNAAVDIVPGAELGGIKKLFDEYAILNARFPFAGSVTRPRTIGTNLRLNLTR